METKDMLMYGGAGLIGLVALGFIIYIFRIVSSRKAKENFSLPELEAFDDEDLDDGFNVDSKATTITKVDPKTEAKMVAQIQVEDKDAPIEEVLSALDRVSTSAKQRSATSSKKLPLDALNVQYQPGGAKVSTKKKESDETFDSFLEDLNNEY